MKNKKKKVLFYYLSAFRHTGGIEKFNRCFIKALNELPETDFDSSIISVYDTKCDSRYNTHSSFKGFGKQRGLSVGYIIRHALKSDVLVLGHINLAIAGLLVKLLKPTCRLIVISHGIEIWGPLSPLKKWCLRKANLVLAVSNYTKNQLVLKNGIPPSRIGLFHNTIDPFFKIPGHFHKPGYLLERYGLSKDQKIILTLSRISDKERDKGYDRVIAALPAILNEIPGTVYVLAGKYNEVEKTRIGNLLIEHGVQDNVILTGFIDDEEISDLYRLGDVFIMPSNKEGFGIVFLESLACGTSVIGGNQDGTVDALQNGSLGTLINPTKVDDIGAAIIRHLKTPVSDPGLLQSAVLQQYQFKRYQERLEMHLDRVLL